MDVSVQSEMDFEILTPAPLYNLLTKKRRKDFPFIEKQYKLIIGKKFFAKQLLITHLS